MKIKNLILLGTVIAIGSYLTSKEGSETRKRLKSVGNNLKPILKDLINKSEKLIQKSKTMDSEEARANLEQKAEEVKKSLLSINPNNVTQKANAAIKSASRSIRKMWNDISEPEGTKTTKVKTNPEPKKTRTTKVKSKTTKTRKTNPKKPKAAGV